MDFLPLYDAFSITGLFCFVALGFYGLFAAWTTEREPPFRGGLNVVTILLCAFFLLFSNAARLFDDPHALLFWFAIYLIGGPVWGIIHWLLFVVHRRNMYLRLRREFSSKTTLDDAERKRFEESLTNYQSGWLTFSDEWYCPFCCDGKLEIIPLARHNAARIAAWMMYWPLSILGWLLRDALRWALTDLLWNFWRWVQGQFAAMFDAISRSIFGSVADEIKKRGDQ